MKKRTTIKDVAKLAGVSVGTVSMILNGSEEFSPHTRENVLQVVDQLKYRRNPHARSLGSKRSNRVGLVVTDLTNPFFGQLVGHIQSEINSYGFDLVLGMTNNSNSKEKRVVSHFLDNAADGVLIIPAHDREQDSTHIHELISYETPFVFVTSHYQDVNGDCVMTDLASGSYSLSNHLIESGHRRLVMVSGYRGLVLSEERISGFMRSCKEHGISKKDISVIETEPDFRGGYHAFDEIIKNSIPDAILAVNDIVAMGIIKRAKEQGFRVPLDISVAGYDDLFFSSMLEKPLTTVRQPIEQIAERSVECLICRLASPDLPPQRHLLNPQVHLRASTRTTIQ
jgi:LacI family transcriptional regulator